MDFRGVVEDVARLVSEQVATILKKDLSAADKKRLINGLFHEVGRSFADKLFADVSELLDAGAIKDVIEINYEAQIERLATKIVRDHAFRIDDERIVKEYFDVLLARSEEVAFKNAKSLEKHPTLTRIATGLETCDWCEARTGTFTDPDGELFRRHDDCDCIFIVRGFNSRNGLLKNYARKDSR